MRADELTGFPLNPQAAPCLPLPLTSLPSYKGPGVTTKGTPLPLDTWVSGGEVSLRRCHCGQGPLGSCGELHSASCRTSWLTRPCCPAPLPNSLHLADPAPFWKLSFPYSWEAFLNPPFVPGSMIGSLFSTGVLGFTTQDSDVGQA